MHISLGIMVVSKKVEHGRRNVYAGVPCLFLSFGAGVGDGHVPTSWLLQ